MHSSAVPFLISLSFFLSLSLHLHREISLSRCARDKLSSSAQPCSEERIIVLFLSLAVSLSLSLAMFLSRCIAFPLGASGRKEVGIIIRSHSNRQQQFSANNNPRGERERERKKDRGRKIDRVRGESGREDTHFFRSEHHPGRWR